MHPDAMSIEQAAALVREALNPTPRAARMKPGEAGFNRGIATALVAIYQYAGLIGAEWREVKKMANEADLLRVTRRAGLMRASGLSEYLQTQNGKDTFQP